MNELRTTARRVQELEAWWALVSRVLAFIAGTALLVWTVVIQQSDELLGIVAGVGLCGPVVAQSVATVFSAIRGVANGTR